MKDVSIIIVDTNEWRVLETALRSVFKETKGITFEVTVVDNASTDGSGENIARLFPQVNVIRNEYNMGFAAANNRAIRTSKARYVLLLNPDTEVLDGAIQKTVKFMDEHPKAGILGCRLIYPDGRFQHTTYSFPTVWNMFSEATFLYKIFPRTKIFGSYHLSYLDYDQDVQVDWLIGAYFLIRREVIETVGLLDEQIYMYAEDLDYCYRTKKAGFEIWLTPRARVIHYYGGISGVNKRVAVWTHRSQVLFYTKHFSWPKSRSLILIKYFGLVLRTIWYFIAGVFTANKRLFRKSWYAIFSIYKLLISHWRYVPGYHTNVRPWEPV
jgi:GT2 family glycosyltransferase